MHTVHRFTMSIILSTICRSHVSSRRRQTANKISTFTPSTASCFFLFEINATDFHCGGTSLSYLHCLQGQQPKQQLLFCRNLNPKTRTTSLRSLQKKMRVTVLLSLASMAVADRHTTFHWLESYHVLGQDVARLSFDVLDHNSNYIDDERSDIWCMVNGSPRLPSVDFKMAIDLSENRVIALIRWGGQHEGVANFHIIYTDDGAFVKVRRRCEAMSIPLS